MDIFDTVTVRLIVRAVCGTAGAGVPTWKLQVRVQAWLLLPRDEGGTPLLQRHRHRGRVRATHDGKTLYFNISSFCILFITDENQYLHK